MDAVRACSPASPVCCSLRSSPQVARAQLHDAGGRRDRRPRCFASADEHPAGVPRRARCSACSAACSTPTCRRTACSPEPAAVAAVRRAVPRARSCRRAAQPPRGRPTRSPASTRRPARSRRVERSPFLTIVHARVRRPSSCWSSRTALFFHADASGSRVAIQAVDPRDRSSCRSPSSPAWAGEISLCQATFAGIGAFTTAQLADRLGMAVLARDGRRRRHRGRRRRPARAPGAPARRHLPVAGDVRVRAVLRQRDGEVRLGRRWHAADRPRRGRRSARSTSTRATRRSSSCASSCSHRRRSLVIAVREGTTGRVLDALRGSETAATSIGIDRDRARASSSSRCRPRSPAIGGGMLAMHERGRPTSTRTSCPFKGLVWVVLVVSLGLAHGRRCDPGRDRLLRRSSSSILNRPAPVGRQRLQPWYHMGQPPQTLAIILLSSVRSPTRSTPKASSSTNKRTIARPRAARHRPHRRRRRAGRGGLGADSRPTPWPLDRRPRRSGPREPARRPGVTKTFSGITALDDVEPRRRAGARSSG